MSRSGARLDLAWCLAAFAVLGAQGCDPAIVPIGDDTCDPSRCGDVLGLPILSCEDGSIGGNTGRCLPSADGTRCSWELRECPVTSCTSAMCGTPPVAIPPSRISCERDHDGLCAWVVSPDPCGPSDCTGAHGNTTVLCADGSLGGFTGRCITTAAGTCDWENVVCAPSTECTLAACGPLGSPPVLCGDGSLGGNTGRCLRDTSSSACAWEIRVCPGPGAGCVDGGTCAAGEACISPVGLCGTNGTCTRTSGACGASWMPVCGCDARTYANACTALAHGVSILHDGACVTSPGLCGGVTCSASQYCDHGVDPSCATSSGTCVAIPPICPATGTPVCGCNAHTYGNACYAAAASISVAHAGACDATFACGATLSCRSGVELCDVTSAGETCTALPSACVADPRCATCFPSTGTCTDGAIGEITLRH